MRLSRLADRLYGPFERALRPLDIPVAPVPEGVGAPGLVWHFARLFRQQLAVVGALTVAAGLINLAVVWGLAFVVDGVASVGAAAFLERHAWTLAGFALLLGVVEPVLAFASAAYLSQAVGVSLPRRHALAGAPRRGAPGPRLLRGHLCGPGRLAPRPGHGRGAARDDARGADLAAGGDPVRGLGRAAGGARAAAGAARARLDRAQRRARLVGGPGLRAAVQARGRRVLARHGRHDRRLRQHPGRQALRSRGHRGRRDPLGDRRHGEHAARREPRLRFHRHGGASAQRRPVAVGDRRGALGAARGASFPWASSWPRPRWRARWRAPARPSSGWASP